MSQTQAERELNVKTDLCYTSETDRLLLNSWASNSLWLTGLAHSGAASNIKDHEAVPAPSAQGEKQGRRVGTGCTARPEPLAASSMTPQQLDLYRAREAEGVTLAGTSQRVPCCHAWPQTSSCTGSAGRPLTFKTAAPPSLTHPFPVFLLCLALLHSPFHHSRPSLLNVSLLWNTNPLKAGLSTPFSPLSSAPPSACSQGPFSMYPLQGTPHTWG